jgi:hypothetical protein
MAAALFGAGPEEDGGFPSAPFRPMGDLLAEPGLHAFLTGLARQEERFHTPKDSLFLEWRYVQCPGIPYGALWDLSGRSGAVLIARRRRRRKMMELTLAEVMVSNDPAGIKAAAKLLRQAAAGTPCQYIAGSVASPSPERKALRKAGFLPFSFKGPWVTVRPLAKQALSQDPLAWTSWRPSLGDLELF